MSFSIPNEKHYAISLPLTSMSQLNKQFISVDWGTTHLRTYLVKVADRQILSESKSSLGIKKLNNEWEDSKEDREAYFIRNLLDQIRTFRDHLTGEEPIIISGMASSSIGMRNLPYASLSFSCDGSDVYLETIKSKNNRHPIHLISGVKAEEDVMRGEETQIIGLFDQIELPNLIMVLPGTHSKHVQIKDDKISDFSTHITGEIFNILCMNSILKDSVSQQTPEEINWRAFNTGVKNSAGQVLLNELFKIRARDLFNSADKTENYFFLSGLLIGYELRNLQNTSVPIYIASSGQLKILYQTAAETLGFAANQISEDSLNWATTNGQIKIIQQRKLLD